MNRGWAHHGGPPRPRPIVFTRIMRSPLAHGLIFSGNGNGNNMPYDNGNKVGSNKEGDGNSGKSDDNCDKEGNGDGSKSNGDGNK
jgi:hypothetical protein